MFVLPISTASNMQYFLMPVSDADRAGDGVLGELREHGLAAAYTPIVIGQEDVEGLAVNEATQATAWLELRGVPGEDLDELPALTVASGTYLALVFVEGDILGLLLGRDGDKADGSKGHRLITNS